MIERPLWNERLAAAWKQASIVWLTGPRRVGKTVLAQSIPDAEFLNCDLPSVAERLRDPESFYRSVRKLVVILDQHREVDFVVPRSREAVDAIECKWKPDAFETRGLAAFREHYPKGKNFVVSPLNGPAYDRTVNGMKVLFVSPGELRLNFG